MSDYSYQEAKETLNKLKKQNLKQLLNDCKDTLQHIVDSDEWDTLQDSSSAKDLIKEIEEQD